MTDTIAMEKLLACVLLLNEGLITVGEYQAVLDELFMDAPEDALLLALEWTHDLREAKRLILRESSAPERALDQEAFSRFLLKRLEKIWTSSRFTLREFGQHTYQLWEVLPRQLQEEDPLRVLAYADDPLSWHDEQASLRIYEKLFRFYDN